MTPTIQTTPISQTDVDDFLAKLVGASLNTREAYRHGLGLFLQFQKRHGFEFGPALLQQFDERLAKYRYIVNKKAEKGKSKSRRQMSKATRQLYVTALRRLLDHLDADDRLPTGFRASAEAKLKATRSKRSISSYTLRKADPELPKLIGFYDKHKLLKGSDWEARLQRLELLRSRALMHTLYDSGGRISEVLSLKRLDVGDGQIDAAKIVGKGGKARHLLLTAEALTAIQAYCAERGNDANQNWPGLFVSHRKNKGQNLSRKTAWKLVADAAHALNLNNGIASPHAFRHFRAMQLLNEGMPLESVQQYLGHASPETTRKIYASETNLNVLQDQLVTYGLKSSEAMPKPKRKANP